MRQDLLAALHIFRTAGRVVLTVWLIVDFNSIVMLAAIALFTDVLQRLLLMALRRRVAPSIRFGWRLATRARARELIHFSSFLFVSNISRLSFVQSGPIVVGVLLGPAAVAVFSIAMNIIEKVSKLMSFTIAVTVPAFSRMIDPAERKFMQLRFLTVLRISVLFTVLLMGSVIVVGQDFITAWVGIDKISAYLPLVILAIGFGVDISQLPATTAMLAFGRNRFFAWCDLSLAIVVVVLAVLLGQVAGLVGVALALATPLVIYGAVVKPIYACRILELKLARYYGAVLRVAVPAAVVQLPMVYVMSLIEPTSTASVLGVAFAGYSIVAGLALLVSLPKSDQLYLVGILPRPLARTARGLLPYLRTPVPAQA